MSGALAISCQNMLTGKDIKDQVTQDVTAANAASITVTINANPSSGGVLSLSGQQTEKVGVAFTLTATPYDANYVFGGWTAAGSGNVTFAAAGSETTTATIGNGASNIVITAAFTPRPAVLTYSPTSASNNVLTNQPIVINFSKAMDPASFTKAGNVVVTYDTINPTNPNPHTIFTSGSTSTYLSYSATSTQLRLTPIPPNYLPSNSTITVTLSSSICDSTEIPIGGTTGSSFYFYTGILSDTSVPKITSLAVLNGDSTASAASTFTSSSTTYYAVKSPTVTFVSQATSNSSTATVQTLKVVETGNAGGQPKTVTTEIGYTSPYVYTLQTTDEGNKTVTISVLNSTSIESALDQLNVCLDETAPKVTLGTFTSSNATNTAYAKTGDTISVGLTVVDTGSGPASATCTIAGSSATVNSGYTAASIPVRSSSPNGTVNTCSITVTDAAGNGTTVSTGASGSVTVDRTAPTISGAVLSSSTGTSWAKQGSTITLTFAASDNSGGSGLASGSPAVTVKSGGAALTGTPSLSNTGSSYTWTYVMQSGDTDGAITYTIAANDNASNAATPVTAGTGSVTYDHTPPTISGATLSSSTGTSWAKRGSTITLTFLASDNSGGSGLASGSPAVTVSSGGAALTGTPSLGNSGSSYTWTYVMQSGDTEGPITYSISANDNATNAAAPVTTGTGIVSYDRTSPTISGATLSSSTGSNWARPGSTITLTFTASDGGSGLANGSPAVTVKSGGAALTGSPSLGNTGSSYTWTYVMQPGDTEGAITYSIAGSDNATNAATPLTSGTGSVAYDRTAPSLISLGAPSGAGIYVSGSTYYTTGTSLSFSPTATDTGSGVKGYNLDGSTTAASYPLSLSAGSSHTIYAVDNAGNVGTLGTVTVTQDTTPPGLSSLGAPSGAGIYANGSTYYTTSGSLSFSPTATECGIRSEGLQLGWEHDCGELSAELERGVEPYDLRGGQRGQRGGARNGDGDAGYDAAELEQSGGADWIEYLCEREYVLHDER